MTDFTDEEMLAIIDRSIKATAERMRRKYKLKKERTALTSAARTGEPRRRSITAAPPDRSGE